MKKNTELYISVLIVYDKQLAVATIMPGFTVFGLLEDTGKTGSDTVPS